MSERHPDVKLRRFLASNHLNQAQFARLAGLEPATVSRLLSGKRGRCSVAAACAIHEATGGEVSAADCLLLPSGKRVARSRP